VVESGTQHVTDARAAELARAYALADWRVFVLPHGIDSADKLKAAAQAVLPLDPPLNPETPMNWNAFTDSLVGGIYDVEADKIAIVWPDAGCLARSEAHSFEDAVDILGGLPEDFSPPEETHRPKDVAVVIADLANQRA